MDEYSFDVRITVGGMSEKEAMGTLDRALSERIDGHTLEAQRGARVHWVQPVDDDLVTAHNNLHDAIQAYDDAMVTREDDEAADALREAAVAAQWLIHRKLVRP